MENDMDWAKVIQWAVSTESAGEPTEPRPFFTELHYNGFPAVLVRLAAIDSGNLAQKLKNVFLKRMLTDQKAFRTIKRQREFLVTINLLAGGSVGLYSDWPPGKFIISMPELANIVNDIAMNAMREYI
jgi:hypothetical protein